MQLEQSFVACLKIFLKSMVKFNNFRNPIFPLKNLFFRFYTNYICTWLREGERGWMLSRSTWSIVLIILFKLRSKNKLNIYLPSYYCSEVVDIIKLLNANIFFYDLEDSLAPSLPKLKILIEKNPPDIFILVHYFPNFLQREDIKLFFKNLNTWIIEDATQCFIPTESIGSFGHFILYSPYKFLPVSSGAILVLTEKGQNTKFDNKLFNSLIKEIELRFVDFFKRNWFHHIFYLKVFVKSILIFFKLLPIYPTPYKIKYNKIDKLQKPRLNKLDDLFLKICTNNIENIVNKRKQNLMKLIEATLAFGKNKIDKNFLIILNNYNSSKNNLPITFPLFFNNKINVKNVYYNLFKSNIEANMWPDLPEEVIISQNHLSAKKFRSNIIHFPIHQSISFSAEKLKFIFNKLLN